jgi:hypothetical protein
LKDGVWRLKVVTRFSTAQHLLKEPRAIVYEYPLTVASPSSD